MKKIITFVSTALLATLAGAQSQMRVAFPGYNNRPETLVNFPARVTFADNIGGSGFSFAEHPFLDENGFDLRFLDEKGAPQIVQRAFILPPRSNMGVAAPDVIAAMTRNSMLYSKYAQVVDRESAYEILERRKKAMALQPTQAAPTKQAAQPRQAAAPAKKNTALDRAVNSAMGQVGRDLGRSLTRGLFGNIIK